MLEAIARRFSQAATGHGDHDISATYLASLPERAARGTGPAFLAV